MTVTKLADGTPVMRLHIKTLATKEDFAIALSNEAHYQSKLSGEFDIQTFLSELNKTKAWKILADSIQYYGVGRAFQPGKESETFKKDYSLCLSWIERIYPFLCKQTKY